MKCPVCQKQKSEYEMRPLINVAELQVGAELSGEKSEKDIGGTKVDVVCRSCWEAILKTKSKEEVIEMFETLCGLLFEMEKRAVTPTYVPAINPGGYQVGNPPWLTPNQRDFIVGTPSIVPCGTAVAVEQPPTWIYKVTDCASTQGVDCESTNSMDASKLEG
jgi:hypothetical protein